jgi:hypothetical protein
MASTGTATFTRTRDQIIASALRKIRVLQDGQTASASQINDAAENLNLLIKQMMSDGMFIWTYQLVTIQCQVNKYTYTVGPSGADITTNRPLRLIDGSYIRDNTNATTPLDTPLTLLPRLTYLQYGSKTTQGIPNSIYYDQQFNTATATSPSTGYGTLYVYSNPMDANHIIYANFQRQLFDMTGGTDEFDFPAEAFMALQWRLAAELADEYEVPEDRIKRIEAKAKYYVDALEDWAVEEGPTQFTPDWQMGQRMR